MTARWLRHGNTWFAGVNALPNDANGAVGDGPPLSCSALQLAQELYGIHPLDLGQLSITYPGYPRQDADESNAAHRFRRKRDAAHVDGLIPEGPNRRRYLREPHAFILGLPLGICRASPLVVWDRSHDIIRGAFQSAFAAEPIDRWPEIDVTEIYQEARRRAFDCCERIEVPVVQGEATLVHRLALHGVAPWDDQLADGHHSRAIVYFRPEFSGGCAAWLGAP